jgi:hypothetical protein
MLGIENFHDVIACDRYLKDEFWEKVMKKLKLTRDDNDQTPFPPSNLGKAYDVFKYLASFEHKGRVYNALEPRGWKECASLKTIHDELLDSVPARTIPV